MKKGHDKLFTIVYVRDFLSTDVLVLEVIDYNITTAYVIGKDSTGREITITNMADCVTIIDFSKTTHDWLNLKLMVLKFESRGLALEILEKEDAIVFKGEDYHKMVERANKKDNV